MPNPELVQSGGVYQFTWESGLSIKLDKLREDSRMGTTGEILVRWAGIGHIHQIRYNLLSNSGRNGVAKYCASRIPEQDWDSFIEVVSRRTIEAFRAGELVIRLGDVKVSDALQYRLRPILVDREANLVYGEGGLGKSMISAVFATLIQEGLAVGPLDPEPGRVLYLDYEASKEDQARRFRKVYKGLDLLVPVEVFHRFCFLPLAHDIQEIQRAVLERNIQLVVVDSAGPACGGEPESAAAVIPFFSALRSLRITSLVVAHKAKNATTVGPFGSAYWMNMPRNVFEVKKAQEVDSNVIHLLLRHVKANDGTLMRPMGVWLEFTPDAVTFGFESAADVPEFESEMPTADRIATTLQGGALSVADLAEQLALSESAVRATLNKFRDKRFVREGNQWGNLAR